ncbi:MAG: tripartite tricarboxylate transporter substrate-binding protein [Alphaproteobacteria bacterium]|nr:tripartite tricarboxylate transporter substrate-binding protein [Alphaproteobacteria bacterium]
MKPLASLKLACLFAALGFAAVPQAADAQSAESFYKGKHVSLMIGYRPGGGYDIYARLVARHYGAFIPGKPTIVPQNKPGSGSLTAANYLYNVAPKDGSVVAAIGQAVYFMQVLERPKIKFDARKFTWIGRMASVNSMIFSWHKTKLKTIKDAYTHKAPIAVGGTLSGSTLYISFLNKLTGAKFQPIKGYGSAASLLALERGEVDASARMTWAGLKTNRPQWLKEGKLNLLVQVAVKKAPDLPNVPLLWELTDNKEHRTMLEVLSSSNGIGRSLSAPPDLPADRVAALRAAFDAMVKSDKFLAEAKRMRLQIDPLPGDELRKLVLQSGDLTPSMVKQIQDIINIKYKSIKKSKKKKKKKN